MSAVAEAPGDRSTSPEVTLSRMDRYQPVLLLASVAVGLIVARAAPAVASRLSSLVTVGVVTLIYLVMLGLDLGRLAGSITERRFLTVAVGVNFIVNPLLAWTLSRIFLSGQPDLQIGLILFLVTPCIGWYLIFTELAGGDTALGVSLLGVNLALQVLFLPIYLLMFAGQANTVDLSVVLRSVGLYLLLPALAAGITRAALQGTAGGIAAVQRTVDNLQLKALALVLVIVAMFASQGDVVFDNPRTVLRLVPPLLAFFGLAFAMAIVVGRLAGLSPEQVALLVFTTTSRNSEASLAIAATAFASPFVALVVVIGPVVELPLLVAMVRGVRALRRRQVI